MNKNKGFTLIELLVVIAIIVILAMIVFPGVRTATEKAKDARIVSEISQMRTQAEIFYTNQNPNTYDGLAGDPTIAKLVSDVEKQNGTASSTMISTNGDDGYRIYTTLNEKSGSNPTYVCVDSDSTTYKGATAPTAGAYTCPTP